MDGDGASALGNVNGGSSPAPGQTGEAGGRGGDRDRARAAALEQAQGQLASLDWALLALIPAAELQAVDRALSLDPVDVDKVACTFLEAAENIQLAFTEMRVEVLDCDEETQLKLEIHGLEEELAASNAMLEKLQGKATVWKQVLAQQRIKLSKALEAV